MHKLKSLWIITLFGTTLLNAVDLGGSISPGLGFLIDTRLASAERYFTDFGLQGGTIPAPRIGVTGFIEFPLEDSLSWGLNIGFTEWSGAVTGSKDSFGIVRLTYVEILEIDVSPGLTIRVPLGLGAFRAGGTLGLGVIVSPLIVRELSGSSYSGQDVDIPIIERLIAVGSLGCGWEFPIDVLTASVGCRFDAALAAFSGTTKITASWFLAGSADFRLSVPIQLPAQKGESE